MVRNFEYWKIKLLLFYFNYKIKIFYFIYRIIVLKKSSNKKNGYVCTLSDQCNDLVKGQTDVLDHEVQAYMSFMGPNSHWYNHNGQKKTSLSESVAGVC